MSITQNNKPKNVLTAPLESHSNSLTPLISIIIPVYNVESTIARCLESCINQSLSDIEILVVDDCGSDNSMQIVQNYVAKDSRIRIITNPSNLGTFAARIAGIRQALGEYIAFLDADDYLVANACEKSYNATQVPNTLSKSYVPIKPSTQEQISDSKPDIVFFGMRFEPSTFKRVSPPVLCKPLFGDEVLYEVFAHCATPPWHICAKLYKASHIRDVIKKLVAHMGENVRLTMAEDVLKSFWLCALARSSVGINDKLYVYYASASSITRKIDATTRDKKIADIRRVMAELESLDSVPEIMANSAFFPAQKQAIAILRSVCELEHRYDGLIHNRTGGAIFDSLYQISPLPSQVANFRAYICLYIFSRIYENLNTHNLSMHIVFFSLFLHHFFCQFLCRLLFCSILSLCISLHIFLYMNIFLYLSCGFACSFFAQDWRWS